LPVQIERATLGPTSDECLRLADRYPAAGPSMVGTLERCVLLVPDDLELLADLGGVYEAAGRARDAEAVYRRAIERDPDYADLHERLARLLLQRGEVDDARAHAAAALALQPNRRRLIELMFESSSVAPENGR